MKNLSVREIRDALPTLDKLLAKEGEVTITRHGKPIARVTPIGNRRNWADLDEFRRRQPKQQIPSEVLIREDRDR